MNPNYSNYTERWQKMRDCLDGETAMKQRTLGQNSTLTCCTKTNLANTKLNQYLRKSQGLIMDTEYGDAKFCDYVYRSMYYPFPSTIHSQSLGMINSRPADIVLPDAFEYLLEDATPNKETLEKVLSSINSEQLSVGRNGIMLETVTGSTTNAFNIISYTAENILDWEYTTIDGEQVPSWIKLKECVSKRNGSTLTYEDQYRILQLDENGDYFQYVTENENCSPDMMPPEESRIYPEVQGKKSKLIPFVCINVESLGFCIENPFLEPSADASIKLFQADAEYRNTMYFTSNATLVTIGVSETEQGKMRVGAGGYIGISASDGDAKFISAPADSLDANAGNVNDLKMYNANLGVDLMQTNSAESGEALNTRLETKTASLKTLSETGANGLQRLLAIGAEWQGVTGDLSITGNTDFKTRIATPKDLLDLMGVKMGGGISELDYFQYAKKNGYTQAETLEDYKKQVEVETVI